MCPLKWLIWKEGQLALHTAVLPGNLAPWSTSGNVTRTKQGEGCEARMEAKELGHALHEPCWPACFSSAQAVSRANFMVFVLVDVSWLVCLVGQGSLIWVWSWNVCYLWRGDLCCRHAVSRWPKVFHPEHLMCSFSLDSYQKKWFSGMPDFSRKPFRGTIITADWTRSRELSAFGSFS